MKNTKSKVNKGLIVLNKGERIAVISLLTIIAILLAISVFYPTLKLTEKDWTAFHNLDSLIALQEKNTLVAETEKPQPQAQPQPRTEKAKTIPEMIKTPPKTTAIPILDINTADSLALVDLPQIGEVMASRIQRYRNRLGGFVSLEQLYEVKGMDTMRFETIRPYIVIETDDIVKIDVNRDDFKTLLRHPYLEYEQVKAIVNHRERKGLITNWPQLQTIVGEVNPLLEKYICY